MQEASLATRPSTLSSHTIMRQVDTIQTKGNSMHSEVQQGHVLWSNAGNMLSQKPGERSSYLGTLGTEYEVDSIVILIITEYTCLGVAAQPWRG